MKSKMSIHRVFFFNIIAIALIVIFAFGVWEINNLYKDFKQNNKMLQQKYETQQKEIIKNEVQKMVFYIKSMMHHYEGRANHDIESAKTEILKTLVNQRFGDNGYFFGSTYSGDPLFSNGKITVGTGSVWDLTDPNGVKIIQEQIKTARNPEGGFVHYSWNKLGETDLTPKISYVTGISEWQWVIGAGVYVDEIENQITLLKVDLKKKVKENILAIFVYTLIFLAVLYFIAKLISKRVKSNFDLFFNFFQKIDDLSARVYEQKLDFS